MHAINNLLSDIQVALRHPKGKLYTIFIDFKKAFDLLDRQIIMKKLETIIGDNYLTHIIRCIMTVNRVTIDDNVTTSTPIVQTNGVLQGDPISPLLFNITTADVVQALKIANCKATIYLYSDDMVLCVTKHRDLQESFNTLIAWTEENALRINKSKTLQMVFRKGGRVATHELVYYGQEPLKQSSHYKYLGVKFQTTGTCFSKHIAEKSVAAIRAINDIKLINRLSLDAAKQLFTTKNFRIFAYGLQIVWIYLKKKDLEQLEKVKATFLKRVLGVSKMAPSG